MKKLFLLFALMVMYSTVALADQEWGGYFNFSPTCVQLYNNTNGTGNGAHPKPHRGSDPQIALAYEGNTFVLAVPSELENVSIVIRDADDEVLYYNIVATITDYYMFQVSNDVLADMATIEIYYGDNYLYGEF